MHSIQRFKAAFFLFMVGSCILITNAQPVLALDSPEVNAISAVLMDMQTGDVLYAKNPNLKRPPASTTKIVTGLLALEDGEPNRIVKVSPEAAKAEGSSVWLQPGEEQRLQDLVYGLMLGSGNDAARAIAEGIAGSEKDFARRMTEKARQLGATNTRFQNASGLPDEQHYTTAYDLALLTRYAMNNKKFAEIVQTKAFNLPGNTLQKERRIFNHNKLLWRYQFADGVKTGYTREAGKCLVASANKNGRRLVAVVFHSKTMYEDCKNMMEFGFEQFRVVSLDEAKFREVVPVKTGVTDSVAAIPGKDLKAVIPAGDLGKVRVETDLTNGVEAPVARYQHLGEVKLFVGERLLETAPLLAVEDVPRDTLVTKIISWFKNILGIHR